MEAPVRKALRMWSSRGVLLSNLLPSVQPLLPDLEAVLQTL